MCQDVSARRVCSLISHVYCEVFVVVVVCTGTWKFSVCSCSETVCVVFEKVVPSSRICVSNCVFKWIFWVCVVPKSVENVLFKVESSKCECPLWGGY